MAATGAERAKAFRDRQREKRAAAAGGDPPPAPAGVAVPRGPQLVPPPEVSTIAAADLAPPPLEPNADALPAEAVAAAAAAPPPEALPAAPPPPPDEGARAIGEMYGAFVAWGCEQAAARHDMPPPVAMVVSSGLLPKLSADAAAELAMKYGIRKPPPALTVAVGGGVAAWGAWAPATKKKPAAAAVPDDSADAAPPAPAAPAGPAQAPWAGGEGDE